MQLQGKQFSNTILDSWALDLYALSSKKPQRYIETAGEAWRNTAKPNTKSAKTMAFRANQDGAGLHQGPVQDSMALPARAVGLRSVFTPAGLKSSEKALMSVLRARHGAVRVRFRVEFPGLVITVHTASANAKSTSRPCQKLLTASVPMTRSLSSVSASACDASVSRSWEIA